MRPKKQSSPSAQPSRVSAAIKAKCNKALASCNQNPKKSLKIIKELISEFQHVSFLRYIEAQIHCKSAEYVKAETLKQRCLRDAAGSAREAVALAPNSIEYLHFLATILFQLGRSINRDYFLEVIDVCSKGLLIENPQDPIFDSTQEEGFSGKEESVENVKQKLRALINMVEEGVTVEQAGLDSKESMEMDSLDETTEIEKILLQKLDFITKAMKEEVEWRPESKIFRWDYWETVRAEEKLGLLKINIEQLRAHFDSDELAHTILQKALDYGRKENKWRSWMCPVCQVNFSDSKLWIKHLRSECVWTLKHGLEKMEPPQADTDCEILQDREEESDLIVFSDDFLSLIIVDVVLLDLYSICRSNVCILRTAATEDQKPAVLKNFTRAVVILEVLCSRKVKQLVYRKILQDFEVMNVPLHQVLVSGERELRKKKDISGLTNTDQIRLIVIPSVLNEADFINRKKFKAKASLLDGISCEVDQAELCIRKAIENHLGRMDKKISEVDAKILACKASMKQREKELASICVYDYLPHMILMLRTFIQAQLEDLVQNDAKIKSDCEEKALLIEAALEDNKACVSTNSGGIINASLKKE